MTSTSRTLCLRQSLLLATMLGGAALPGAALAQAGATWPTQGGDSQGTRYSSLNQINSSNVGGLVEEYKIPTHTFQNHEGGPLVVNNMMYMTTPWPNNLMAVDLTQGHKVVWTFRPGTAGGARAQACCDFDNRGAAYAGPSDGGGLDGMIVYNTLDGFIYGVDATTGVQVWKTMLEDYTKGITFTGAPIIADGIAIVGNSGAEDVARGAVYGVNVQTGQLVWKAYNTGPDADVLIGPNFHAYYKQDNGTDLGVTSWNGTNWWQYGGATAWGYKTYDPVLDLVYYGTGNADPWSAVARGGQGDAKWAATIFARKPQTGEAVWATQLTPDDQWDYDSISESIVADIPINGAQKHILFHTDKNGYAYTLDARTGQIITYGDVTASFGALLNWSTGIDMATGRPKVVPSHIIRGLGPSKGIQQNCPSPAGVKEWSPAAYSFQTNLFYIPAHTGCTSAMDVEAFFYQGTPLTAWSSIPGQNATPPGSPGALVAWNAATGKPAWVDPEPYYLWGGVMSTAGDLVFYGTLSNGTDAAQTPTFKAVDAATGKLLWSVVMECNTVGTPMTFLGPDGKQRIAIFTGTGGIGAAGTGKCPNLTIFHPAKSPPGTEAVKVDDSKFQHVLYRDVKVPLTTDETGKVKTGYLHVFKLP